MPLSPATVHERLRSAAQRFRWSRAGRYLVSGAAISFSFLILFLLCDAEFHLGAVGRWIGFLLTVAPLLGGIAWALPAWMQTLPELAIARRIETSCLGAGNALVNAIQFDRELPPGSALRAAIFHELKDPFPGVNWSEVFDLKLLKKLALALALSASVLFLWAVAQPMYFVNSAARIFLPGSNIAPITRTRLDELTPGNATVVHGGEFVVSMRLGGEIPRAAWVRFREAGSTWQRELMDRQVGLPDFSFRWKEVRQPMEYAVEAGDLQSAVYQVAVRPRAAISRRTAEITPPAYSRLPVRTVTGFTSLNGVLPGSTVALTLDFNQAVRSLDAADEQAQPVAAVKRGDLRWTLTFPVTASRTLRLGFHDADDLLNEDTLPITIKADEPPKIAITDPAEGRELVAAPGASLNVAFTATDDLGLGSVALYRSTLEKQDAQLVQQWSGAANQTTFTGAANIDLAQYAKAADERVTFCLVAKDQNDVNGPGVTISRPLIVTLHSADKVQQQAADAAAKLERGLKDLAVLQQKNLDETRAAIAAKDGAAGALSPLLDRQVNIGDLGRELAAAAGSVAPAMRETLRSLAEGEMPAAVLSLRNAGDAEASARGSLLQASAHLESLILARLQGAPANAEQEAQKGQIEDLIGGVENLLRKERDILRDTGAATAAGAGALSDRQDALADQSVKVRKDVERDAQNSSLGDADFRACLGKIAGMFGQFRIYEQMLATAETLGAKQFAPSAEKEKVIVANLKSMTDLLNQWQLANAGQKADELRQDAARMKEKLDRLAALQQAVLEKSKELARKDQFSPDDRSTLDEIARTKQLMEKVIEQMITDAHVFPDMIISNELRSELTSIFEDVKQTDLSQIAKDQLKPGEIAVQKEDGILKAIEATTKAPEDMEMWLPQKSQTDKWLLENFDKSEMPAIPNVPLPDEFTDLVGDLQKEQQDLADKVQDAASNQAIAAMAQGWEVLDGPQSGYGAQGKSGNQRPQDMEQAGRSSGGREGESTGEMVGKAADDLEGRKAKARRTNEAMQSGNVDDPSHKLADAKATGGGKASGFSQREGMDGDAPLRGSTAPKQFANSALAVQQALIAEKTSKKAAMASLLYLRSDKLQNAAAMMQDSQTALKEGRIDDFKGLHKKMMAQLSEAKGEIASGKVLSLATGEAVRADDKQLLGGGEGDAPAPYKDRVADYYRSLEEGK